MRGDDCTIMDANGQSLSLPSGLTVGSAATVVRGADGMLAVTAPLEAE